MHYYQFILSIMYFRLVYSKMSCLGNRRIDIYHHVGSQLHTNSLDIIRVQLEKEKKVSNNIN